MYVGIDVCKGWLDVHLHPIGHSLRVANDAPGLKRLKRELARYETLLVVLEATGKYHRLAQRHLHAAGIPVAVVNPLRSRLFAEAKGALAKTDARLLAVMAETFAPRATPPLPQAVEELQEIVRARTAAVADRTALLNQRAEARVRLLKVELGRRIAALERSIARLESAMQDVVASDPVLARRLDILLSIPGIGPVAALGLMAGLAEELGACSSKQIAMLSGLAPVACDSGDRTGSGTSVAAAARCVPPSTSPPCLPPATMPACAASTNASSPQASHPRSPSSPSCASSSFSPIPWCARTASGGQIQLDRNHRC